MILSCDFSMSFFPSTLSSQGTRIENVGVNEVCTFYVEVWTSVLGNGRCAAGWGTSRKMAAKVEGGRG